jgi:hypothetical protein
MNVDSVMRSSYEGTITVVGRIVDERSVPSCNEYSIKSDQIPSCNMVLPYHPSIAHALTVDLHLSWMASLLQTSHVSIRRDFSIWLKCLPDNHAAICRIGQKTQCVSSQTKPIALCRKEQIVEDRKASEDSLVVAYVVGINSANIHPSATRLSTDLNADLGKAQADKPITEDVFNHGDCLSITGRGNYLGQL